MERKKYRNYELVCPWFENTLLNRLKYREILAVPLYYIVTCHVRYQILFMNDLTSLAFSVLGTKGGDKNNLETV
jgi:hypothetical protein